jgi:hypothetical protein
LAGFADSRLDFTASARMPDGTPCVSGTVVAPAPLALMLPVHASTLMRLGPDDLCRRLGVSSLDELRKGLNKTGQPQTRVGQSKDVRESRKSVAVCWVEVGLV